MQTLTSTSHAHAIIQLLLDALQQHLNQIELKKQMITQLADQSLFYISACLDVQTFTVKQNRQNGIREDQLRNVPHISKDTLMPKEIDSDQSPIQIQNRSAISKTNLSLKKISSISTKNPLLLSSRQSSLLAKSQRYEKSKQKPVSQCQQLKSQIQIDDPQIQKLRERTEIRLFYDSQYRKLQMHHQKSYKQKSQMMSSFLQEEPSSIITHDYDGEQLKSIQGDDKIKHYTLRMGVSPSNIKAKDHLRSLQPLQSEITVQKYSKQRQNHRNLRPMEMPLFQQPKLQVRIASGIENYRLHQYKKHFGRGYSRLDNLSKTIQYNPTKEQQDYFAEKRHLKDKLEKSNVASTTLDNSRVARRLALPKLHGRYKVLDRYEQQ